MEDEEKELAVIAQKSDDDRRRDLPSCRLPNLPSSSIASHCVCLSVLPPPALCL